MGRFREKIAPIKRASVRHKPDVERVERTFEGACGGLICLSYLAIFFLAPHLIKIKRAYYQKAFKP